MAQRPSKKTVLAAAGAMAVLALIVLVLVLRLPVVVGLGSRVKLPIFHGASTWVDIMLFVLMAVAALVFVVRRSDAAYAWEVGLRAVAMPLWAVNSALGFVAALSTWDFTGSRQSPLVVARSDARLTAQFVILLGVAIVLLLDWLVLDSRRHKAFADLGFVAISAVLLSDIFLDPAKRALHPDSPVLNSGWDIKLPFFAIVAAWFACMLVAAWLVSRFVGPETAGSPVASGD
jgi:hypothetical protein